jgi:excisionase family DNA binding protein
MASCHGGSIPRGNYGLEFQIVQGLSADRLMTANNPAGTLRFHKLLLLDANTRHRLRRFLSCLFLLKEFSAEKMRHHQSRFVWLGSKTNTIPKVLGNVLNFSLVIHPRPHGLQITRPSFYIAITRFSRALPKWFHMNSTRTMGKMKSSPAETDSELWTTKEITEYLHVSLKTVFNLRKRGLPYIQLGGAVRFVPQEIKDYLARSRGLSKHRLRQMIRKGGQR